MNLGEPWSGQDPFPWNLALRLEEAGPTVMRWGPENYQLAGCLEVRVYLHDESICMACELRIREAFLRHPWKLKLASRAIGEFLQLLAPALVGVLHPRLPSIEPENAPSPQGRGTLVTPTPPVAPLRGAECENPFGAAAPSPQGRGTLDWLDDTKNVHTSPEARLWVRESPPWRGLVIALKDARPCIHCRGPLWHGRQPCPSCGKTSGGLRDRLTKLAWLLNKPGPE